MSSHQHDLKRLQQQLTEFRDDRDWRQFHTPKNLAAALAIEAAELQQELLWLDDTQVAQALAEPKKREAIADEMADVLAYLLLLSDVTGIELSQALDKKIIKNAQKYPADKCHGSSEKYHAYKNLKPNK